jgi:hypothetical protein
MVATAVKAMYKYGDKGSGSGRIPIPSLLSVSYRFMNKIQFLNLSVISSFKLSAAMYSYILILARKATASRVKNGYVCLCVYF